MKFDFVIGNPPYQDETVGEQKTFAAPVYHLFMDEAYKVGTNTLLIHPARFLFNAGSTPKVWNQKMLDDPYFKVLSYEHDSSKVFANTNINGGIVITYRSEKTKFGATSVFTPFMELNSIRAKAGARRDEDSITRVIFNQTRFDLKALYKDYPEYASILGSNGNDKRFRNNIFEKVSLFTDTKEDSTDITVWGIQNGKRVQKYIPAKYVETEDSNLNNWKIILGSANGASGTLNEEAARIITKPFVAAPNTGYTQTFISIGTFDAEKEAEAAAKYIMTRFARVLLAILKVTQDNKRPVWRFVPIQDFTTASDIDWSQSVSGIDKQLYKKYGLTKAEIAFIEAHVKELE